MTTIEKGNLSEAKFTAKLLELGYEVFIPFGNGSRYDLVFKLNGKFKTLQIKTGKLKDNFIVFNSSSLNKETKKRKSYHGEVDFLGIYCIENNSYYLMPVNKVAKTATTLRLTSPKNNQKKNIHLAKDYQI